MEQLVEKTLGAALREQAALRGAKEAFIFPNRGIRFTFRDMDTKADALAKGLLAAGFKKGDHIGIWAHNVPEWLPLFFASARLGMVAVPINASCKCAEVAYLVRQADLNGLFIIDRYRDTDFPEVIYQLIPELKHDEARKLTSSAFPCLKMVANIDTTPHQGMYTLEDLVQMGSRIDDAVLRNTESAVNSTDILCIMYTSGTTGVPKGAMLTHKGILNNAIHANTMSHIDETSVVLNPLPLFHIMSLTDGIIEILLFGAATVVLEYFDPLLCLSTIQNEHCTMMYGVPAMYSAMLNHPQFTSFNLTSFRYAYLGGALCPPDLAKNLLEKMRPQWLSIGYGLTETSPLVCNSFVNRADDENLITIGRPIPGVEVSIRNPDTSTECTENENGEICVKGYNVMRGYYKNETATHEVIDMDGWFHTGDMGHRLSNGMLVIDGRIKELIIRGGENIYPKEVENLLLSMPGIRDAQVAAIPSEKYGEEAGAFIVLQSGAKISEQEIIDFCKERISSFKVPRYVFFVHSFPLTPSGKVQKFKLSEMGFKEVPMRRNNAF